MDQTKSNWTGSAAFRWATAFLTNSGFARETALFEVRLLLALAWNKDGIRLVTSLDEVLDQKAQRQFIAYIQRRAAKEPLEYILGKQEFMALSFKVTPAVLIPRRDTEVLVKAVLKLLEGQENARILELGTGSGAIAVSLAYYLPSSSVVAVDISSEAVGVARDNARRLGVAERIAFYEGDLFFPLPVGAKYDLIVSNPPYISQEEYKNLPEDVKREPSLALLGGQDGLAYYRRIADNSPAFLQSKGKLLLEIGWQQAKDVSSLLRETGYSVISVLQDEGGRDRVIFATRE